MVTTDLTYTRYQAQYEVKSADGYSNAWAAYHPYRKDLKQAENDLRNAKAQMRWKSDTGCTGGFRIVREECYRTVIHSSEEEL